MTDPDRFTVGEVDVTVTETAGTLGYRFTPRNPPPGRGFPFFLTLFFIGLPLGVLAVVTYALVRTNGNRPEWELVLTGVLVVQLLCWLILGMNVIGGMVRSVTGHGTALTFSAAGVQHGARRVCDLADLSGVRLFVYPASSDPPGKSEACLSMVIGEDGGTHGLFGGFEALAVRALAEDIQRRLTAFRFNQGLLAPLDPLSVVETTENEAPTLMHTRPATGSVSGLLAGGAPLIFTNRWIGLAWSLAMLTGLLGSVRLIEAAGLNVMFLLGHMMIGLMHFMLLMFHLGGHGKPPKATDAA